MNRYFLELKQGKKMKSKKNTKKIEFTKDDYIVLNYEELLKVNGAKSEDLRELFTTKWSKWYKINLNFTEALLTETEIANIQTMYNVENSR